MSTRRGRRIEKIVVPGQGIATIEEYFARDGAYEGVDGVIRPLYLGTAILDPVNKELFVEPLRRLRIIGVGDKVIARILNMTGVYGFISIFARVANGRVEPLDRFFSGIVYPPESRREKDISKIYRVGDFIYGEVVSRKNRAFHVVIDKRDYGVIKAYCAECGGLLVKDRSGKLICSKCKSIEVRKLSPLYGRVI
jgi:exosome complex RNA-binding protein Csl4